MLASAAVAEFDRAARVRLGPLSLRRSHAHSGSPFSCCREARLNESPMRFEPLVAVPILVELGRVLDRTLRKFLTESIRSPSRSPSRCLAPFGRRVHLSHGVLHRLAGEGDGGARRRHGVHQRGGRAPNEDRVSLDGA